MDAFLAHFSWLQNGGVLGYWIVFLLTLGESLAFIGFVIPGALVVVIAGALAAQGTYELWGLLIVVSVAAIAGNALSYELGKHGKQYLRKHPWLWKHATKGQAFFELHGSKSVFIGHFLGPMRHAVPVAAGVADMRRSHFHLANIPASVLWALVHLAIGYIFGSFWHADLYWLSRAGLLLLILVAFLTVAIWLWRWVLKRQREIIMF